MQSLISSWVTIEGYPIFLLVLEPGELIHSVSVGYFRTRCVRPARPECCVGSETSREQGLIPHGCLCCGLGQNKPPGEVKEQPDKGGRSCEGLLLSCAPPAATVGA